MTTYVGIDPGKSGGVAAISPKGARCWRMPLTATKEIDVWRIWESILDHTIEDDGYVRFYVELVHSMPGQGVASTFTFGVGYGRITGMLDSLHLPYELIRPQRWKQALGVTSDKGRSIEKACQLFPELAPTIGRHDGMAEALLIAEFNRRQG